MNSTSGGVGSCCCSLSQTALIGWRDPRYEALNSLNVTRVETGTVHNCPHTWLCYTSRPGKSAYGFVALLPGHRLLQAAFVQPLHLLAGRNRSTVDLWVLFQVFRSAQSCDVDKSAGITQQQPYIPSAETVYEIHVGIFFVCIRVRHLEFPTVIQYNSH